MNDEEEIKKSWEEIAKTEKEQSDKDAFILDKVAKGLLSEGEFCDLEILITESDDTSYYSIENEPNGEYQEDYDYRFLKGYWVNQTTNGGYTGDEYAGTISVKLSNGKYFQFHYSM